MPPPLPTPDLSLRERFQALRNLPPFLRDVWATSRTLTTVDVALRLVRALCAETHETWLEDSRYLNMDLLREERKEQFRKAA